MRRVLVSVWGSDGNAYIGRSMTLYRDPDVMFGKEKVGGIRISHMSHIDRPVVMPLTVSRASRKSYTVKPLVIEREQQKQQAAPFALNNSAADEAALGGVAIYKKFIASLPKDQQTPYTETEAHAMRRNRALAVDRLNACTDEIELEAEWDATPQDVRAALGADVLDSLRAKLREVA
jgi:hypothetical protein